MTNSIEIENLSKEYTLGVVGTGTLYRDLQSFWAKLRGEEDPNSLISSNNQDLHKSKISIHESIEQLNLLENNVSMKALEVKKDIPSLNVIIISSLLVGCCLYATIVSLSIHIPP